MTQLATKEQEALARPLKVLVPLIKEEIEHGREAAEHAAKPFFQRAGDLLLEAKSQIGHGEWEGWVRRNFEISERTAQEWMKYAKELPEYQKRTGGVGVFKPPTLSEITRPTRDYSSEEPSRGPVREALGRINMRAITQERQEAEKERRLETQLILQMIDIGYKVLASKLHPDTKDGSHEAMSRLNRAKNLAKHLVKQEL